MLNNNGSALVEKRAKSILDSGLTRLRFSLDASNPETFKKVYGDQEGYLATMKPMAVSKAAEDEFPDTRNNPLNPYLLKGGLDIVPLQQSLPNVEKQ